MPAHLVVHRREQPENRADDVLPRAGGGWGHFVAQRVKAYQPAHELKRVIALKRPVEPLAGIIAVIDTQFG
jgi:hypothetical protein